MTHILIVEDDKEICQLYSRVLAKNGYQVTGVGPGIPEESLHHVFDKFYQADSVHKQEGSGLGLALVEKILKLEKAP